MSFNLGVSNHPISRMGGLSSVGIYLYEDIYYRQWITEIALAFYEGRQDEFVWLDLVRQFRNPEKQQILPVNLTREIVDETAILYKEDAIYKIVDGNGKVLDKDQKLWDEIMNHSRYRMLLDKVDRWCRLLGTVLVKVSFVDPKTGFMVKKNQGGQVQLDCMHSGVYDIKHGASPYYITELLIGFGTKFQGFGGSIGHSMGSINIADPSTYGMSDADKTKKGEISKYSSVDTIYWSPGSHMQIDNKGNQYKTKNPYGMIPAVPFFNQDPAHYYFLPINEPLIYANHAINMRITDLNHIAKFQSFGVPVVSGVERPTSTRQGRPADDYNLLRGGSAQSRFGGLGGFTGHGAGGQFRSFDAGLGLYRDGNADANALGFSIGPDTAVAVGEKGDFKFAHPSADITGLIKSIQSISDIVRINHGIRPKYADNIPPSGFALWMEKAGVIDENRRRGKLFKEREEQLFQVIKKLWNTHHDKIGDKKFSENSKLEVTYVEPKFPVDPKTKMEEITMENKLRDTGDRKVYKEMYPHMTDNEVKKEIKEHRKDKMEQSKEDAKIDVERAKILQEADIIAAQTTEAVQTSSRLGTKTSGMNSISMGSGQQKQEPEVSKPKIDNKAKDAKKKSEQMKK